MAKPRKPPPAPSGNRNLLLAAAGAAVVVAALIGASLLLRGGDSQAEETPTTPVEVDTLLDGIPQDRAVLGSPEANVTLIQFEDLQCPVCKRYQQEGFPGIVEQYVRPGKVKLGSSGSRSSGRTRRRRFTTCSPPAHRASCGSSPTLSTPTRVTRTRAGSPTSCSSRLSGALGLDYAKLRSDADGAAVRQQASSMASEAEQREVPGTPWFYVQVGNGEPYEVRPSSFEIARVPRRSWTTRSPADPSPS